MLYYEVCVHISAQNDTNNNDNIYNKEGIFVTNFSYSFASWYINIILFDLTEFIV